MINTNIQEIRRKIEGVRSIQKLSKAMEMISASKMYRAQKLMLMSRPYSVAIRKVIDHIASGKSEYRHSYFLERRVQCVGYWVMSSDRGLTGGLNINLFRLLLKDINKWRELGISTKLAIIGSKAVSFFNHIDSTMIVGYVSGIGEIPKMSDLIGLVKIMLDLYNTNKIDKLYLIYNKFVNTLSQVPRILPILPITSGNYNISTKKKYWDYLYEPDSKTLLEVILKRYIEAQIYQGVVENLASEQSARMMAMKTASDNGEVVIKELELLHNKVRQSKITQELIEIISGASTLVKF